MRYRKLDANGDYPFGQNLANFWIDVPAGVRQAIQTVLNLWQGQWFLDSTVGVPWTTQVIGKGTAGIRDAVIRSAILNTAGVRELVSYSSELDAGTRHFRVNAVVATLFGPVSISVTVPASPFTLGSSPLSGPDSLVV